jgi:hypothetical protein
MNIDLNKYFFQNISSKIALLGLFAVEIKPKLVELSNRKFFIIPNDDNGK